MTVKIIQRRRTLGQEQVPLTFPEQRGCGRGQPAMTPHQQKKRGDNAGPPPSFLVSSFNLMKTVSRYKCRRHTLLARRSHSLHRYPRRLQVVIQFSCVSSS